MAFESADLAMKLDLNGGNNNGYKVLILCAQVSAEQPTICGGTNAEILIDGALASQNAANLRKLKEALSLVMAEIDSRLAPPPQPIPAQPEPTLQLDEPQPTS